MGRLARWGSTMISNSYKEAEVSVDRALIDFGLCTSPVMHSGINGAERPHTCRAT